MGWSRFGAMLLRTGCMVWFLVGMLPAGVHADENISVHEALQSKQTSTVPASPAGAETAPALPGADMPSGWTMLLQVFFSLGLVVLLIYLLVRFLAKRQAGARENGPMRVISVMPLGNGKSVHLVQIGDALYMLGVGDNVQLLRHIPAGEEMDLLLAESEIKATSGFVWPDWLPFPRQGEEKPSFVIPSQRTDSSFEELLEQQWDSVNGSQERWEEGEQRGNRP